MASDDKLKSPSRDSSFALLSFNRNLFDLDLTQLEPSKLLNILTKKASPLANFISIPEIQVRDKALMHCGLTEGAYLVIFVPS
ncbi:hypothetical protein NL676_028464 [Syzygium grande]|nr:hypothetical protein NL676_028464 [Syzygium grande]